MHKKIDFIRLRSLELLERYGGTVEDNRVLDVAGCGRIVYTKDQELILNTFPLQLILHGDGLRPGHYPRIETVDAMCELVCRIEERVKLVINYLDAA